MPQSPHTAALTTLSIMQPLTRGEACRAPGGHVRYGIDR